MTKYFNVTNPKQLVTIDMDHGNFYQLSDGNMIKKDTFATKYQPVLEGFESGHLNESHTNPIQSDTYVDPEVFFNSSGIIDKKGIEQLKNTNLNNVPNVTDLNRTQVVNKNENLVFQNTKPNDGILTPVNPDEFVIPNNTNTDVSQYKVFENDEDAYNDMIKKSGQPTPQVQQPIKIEKDNALIEIDSLYEDEKLVYGEEEAINRKNKRMNKLNLTQETNQEPQQNQNTSTQVINTPVMDPITMMFSTFKRSHEIVFNVEFKDKIANPEFVKMMMENMDGDIIGFYKKSIMNNIMKKLSVIENVVENELNRILGEVEEDIVKPVKEKTVVKPVKEKPVVKPVKEKPVVKPVKEKPVVKPVKEKITESENKETKLKTTKKLKVENKK